MKQIIQSKHNMVKNPNWPEAIQLAIYKRVRGFELRTALNKSSWQSERDLTWGPPSPVAEVEEVPFRSTGHGSENV